MDALQCPKHTNTHSKIRCWVDGVDTEDSVAQWNSSEILDAIPLTPSGALDKCLLFTDDNLTTSCSKWVYDTSYRATSRGMEWNLVCDKLWMGALAQSIFMMGVFNGDIFLGGLADRIGRKTVFCWSGVLQLIFGLLVAFMPEFWSFAVITFLYGMFGAAGSFITGYVLVMELMTPRMRTKCGTVYYCVFAVGVLLVAVWGAVIDDKTVLQVVYGLHSIILIPHIWLMDESPRWLWAQGKTREAVNIVQKALQFNNSNEILDVAEYVLRTKSESKEEIVGRVEAQHTAGVIDLFKTPTLRSRTILMCCCWFANSLVYYGLSFSSGKMEGNLYIIIAILGLVDIPGCIVVYYFLDVWGRRPFISTAMLLGGLSCVIAAFHPGGALVSTAILIAGKLFIAGSSAVVYNYSAELFPTVVRNSAIGLGSMFARISGALTPFVALLDSLDPRIPAVTFGLVALVSGFFCLFLPETMNRPLPQTLADGERFGKGESFFSHHFSNKTKTYTTEVDEEAVKSMVTDNNQCWVDGVDTKDSVAEWNSTEILNAIPKTPSGSLEKCLIFTEDNLTASCSKWVFDTTHRATSRGMEWNLICDKSWMGALAQSIFMLGVFSGAIFLGGLSDRIGRKTVYCWSGVLQLFFGVLVAFMPEFWSFSAVNFFYGMFGSAGAFITGYVLVMEIMGPSTRTKCGTVYQCFFSVGILCVAIWGAVIDDKTILQVVYGLHSIILLPHIWLMDESPRWLWAQGKTKEAVKIVQKALKFNNSNEFLDVAEYVLRAKSESKEELIKSTKPQQKEGLIDIFKTPTLRKRTIIMCFCWFANSLVYYGLALSSGKMEGNPYIIIAVLGLVDIPSYMVVYYFLDVWGRRPFISIAMLLGGLACVIAAFKPGGVLITTAIVIAGKLFIAASFAIVYNYSAELFPTVVRNSALGLGSMFARLSAALTPFISLLDSLDPKIPAVTFGLVSLASGFFCLFLPETMNQPLPQSLADGEKFGKGESCFSHCFSTKAKSYKTKEDEDEEAAKSMVVANNG